MTTLTQADARIAVNAAQLGDMNALGRILRALVDGDLATSPAPVAAGSAITLAETSHDGRTILLDTAAGSVVTLPAATGSGMRVRILVSVAPTSNNHRVLCAGTDEFAGVVYQVDTDSSDALVAYPALAADNFDTLTLNGTTTGGRIGDWIEVEDVASGVWALVGHTNASGTVATPLTAAA